MSERTIQPAQTGGRLAPDAFLREAVLVLRGEAAPREALERLLAAFT